MAACYHVTRKREGCWQLQREGTEEPCAVCGSPHEAVHRCEVQNAGREACKIILYRADGKVREERVLRGRSEDE
jgi:hypothetical protein